MAEVMKKAKLIGTPRNAGVIPRNAAVQRALQIHAENIYGKAEVNLARHHKTGNAKVTMHKERIDRWVVLEDAFPGNDPSGKERHSASAIEFGYSTESRYGKKKRHGGLWILHDASGYPRPAR